ncbi:MAG: SpvB/TcaC N-terminal domain-containing protein, partial [Acidobacteriota bacterium]
MIGWLGSTRLFGFNPTAPSKTQSRAVSGQTTGGTTGAFTHSIPIQVPPNRAGMTPQILLHYNSAGAVHGGIAHGWTLDFPMISLDTASSQLGRENEPTYVSSLTGTRLIEVSDTGSFDAVATFRAENDGTFAIYERLRPSAAYEWRVRFSDGSVMQLGERGSDAQTHIVAPVYRHIDRWGNEIAYHYQWNEVPAYAHSMVYLRGGYTGIGSVDASDRPTAYEFLLTDIEYGRRTKVASSHHARIRFEYQVDSCGLVDTDGTSQVVEQAPKGALFSYRSGILIATGRHTLTKIVTEAKRPASGDSMGTLSFKRVRDYVLTYDNAALSCTGTHAPRRLLIGLKTYGYDLDGTVIADLPPMTFDYGDDDSLVDQEQVLFTDGSSLFEMEHGVSPDKKNTYTVSTDSMYEWGEGMNGNGDSTPLPFDRITRKLIDIDGDGRLDLVEAASELVTDPVSNTSSPRCVAHWYANTGVGFSPTISGTIPLPTVPWQNHDANRFGTISSGEFCGLNMQVSAFSTRSQDLQGYSCYTETDSAGKRVPDWHHQKVLVHYEFTDADYDGDIDLIVGVSHPASVASGHPFFATDDRFAIQYNTYNDLRSDLGDFPLYIGRAIDTADNWPSRDGDPYFAEPADVDPSLVDLHRGHWCLPLPDQQQGGFPRLLFANDGTGQFGQTPLVQKMPVPVALPAIPVTWMAQTQWNVLLSTGWSIDSQGAPVMDGVTGGIDEIYPPISILHTDINGDGFLDIVETSFKYISSTTGEWIIGKNQTGEAVERVHDWRVLLGDAEGHFHGDENGDAYVMYVPGATASDFWSSYAIPIAPYSGGGARLGAWIARDFFDEDNIEDAFSTIGP